MNASQANTVSRAILTDMKDSLSLSTVGRPAWAGKFRKLFTDGESLGPGIYDHILKCAAPKLTAVGIQGQVCPGYILGITGTISASINMGTDENVVLYRFGAGQACAISAMAMLSNHCLPLTLVAETDVEYAIVPAPWFFYGIANSDNFRQYVFRNYSRKLVSLADNIQVFHLKYRQFHSAVSPHKARFERMASGR